MTILEKGDAGMTMRKALKPFADFIEGADGMPDTAPITHGSSGARRQLTIGDCRRARAVLHVGAEGWVFLPRRLTPEMGEAIATSMLVSETVQHLWDSVLASAASPLPASPPGEIAKLERENGILREALGFAASVIKSGEPWTDTCVRVIGRALAYASAGLPASPSDVRKPFIGSEGQPYPSEQVCPTCNGTGRTQSGGGGG